MHTPIPRFTRFFLFLSVSLLGRAPAHSEISWPQFRGPNGSGISDADRPPIEFNAGTNLVWKTEFPPGVSSPSVLGGRIFLTAFQGGKLETICVDRLDGRILWRRAAPAERIEEHNPAGSPASATPAAAADKVCVYFGSYGLLAYDLNGNELWRKPLPVAETLNGSGTSPVLIGGRLILNRDQEAGKSSLLAVDPATGKTLWETARPNAFSSYSTPILWRHRDREDVVLAGSFNVTGYDLNDGTERWFSSGLEAVSVCPTPVVGDGRLYVSSRSFGGSTLPPFSKILADMDKDADGRVARSEGREMLASKQVFNSIDQDHDGFVAEREWNASLALLKNGDYGILALRSPERGDVTESHLVWKQRRGAATVPSPLFYRGRLYAVQDGGRFSAYDAASGEPRYEQERLEADGEYYASPVAADGKIFLASTRGTVTVVAEGDQFRVLARNPLGERLAATPAIADDKLYIRTAGHLWAFGKR